MNKELKCKQCKQPLYNYTYDICGDCAKENRQEGVGCHACRGDSGYVTHTCGKY